MATSNRHPQRQRARPTANPNPSATPRPISPTKFRIAKRFSIGGGPGGPPAR